MKFDWFSDIGSDLLLIFQSLNFFSFLRGFCAEVRPKKWNLITFLSPLAPQDPKDIYLVGSKVEYSCTAGFHLIGHSTIECTADQIWSDKPGLCTSEYL